MNQNFQVLNFVSKQYKMFTRFSFAIKTMKGLPGIAIECSSYNPFLVPRRNHQVTVVGGATDMGQTVSLLLRAQANITKLVLHDTEAQTKGVILDLSHVPSNASVKGYVGVDTLPKALLDAEIVICAIGLWQSRRPTDDMWTSTKTSYIKYLAKDLSRLKTKPFIGFITSPINSLVPMAAEVMRNFGDYDPKKLFGITNIDTLRAQSLYATENNLDPGNVYVPVIGGHSHLTSIPLLSQVIPEEKISEFKATEFTVKFRSIYDKLVGKKGISPALSTAYSALLFTRSVLSALDGKPAAVNAYIENNDFGTEYFSGLVHINENGVIEMQTYSDLSSYECLLLEKSIQQLRKDVIAGKKILECN